jgi:hypothetical protein
MTDRRDLAIVRVDNDTPNRRRALESLRAMETAIGSSKPATPAGEIAGTLRDAIQASIGYGTEIVAELDVVHEDDTSRTESRLRFRYRR